MLKAWTLLLLGLIKDLLRMVVFVTKRADNIKSLNLATQEEILIIIIVCQLVSCCLFRAASKH